MNKGIFFIIGAAMLWGTTGTTQAFAPVGASPLTVGAFRLLIGGSALLLVALAGQSFRGYKWNTAHSVLGVISVAAYQISFFTAVKLTGVAVGTIVAIGSGPVFAGILGRLILGENLNIRWYLATLLAIAGSTFLVFSGGSEVSVNPLGIFAALGAGFSYAMYTLIGKLMLVHNKGNAVVAVMFFGGALVMVPVLFVYDVSWVVTVQGMVTMAHLGLLATTLSYILFAKGLQTVSVSKTTTLSLAEPLTAAVLGIMVLGENLNMMVASGIFLLFAGIAILSIEKRKQA